MSKSKGTKRIADDFARSLKEGNLVPRLSYVTAGAAGGVGGTVVPKFCQLDAMAARFDAAAEAFGQDPTRWVQGKFTSAYNQDGVRLASACSMGAVFQPKRLQVTVPPKLARTVTRNDFAWVEGAVIFMNDRGGNTAANTARNLRRLAAAIRFFATDEDAFDVHSVRCRAWRRAVDAAFASSRSVPQVSRQSQKRIVRANLGKSVKPITASGRKSAK